VPGVRPSLVSRARPLPGLWGGAVILLALALTGYLAIAWLFQVLSIRVGPDNSGTCQVRTALAWPVILPIVVMGLLLSWIILATVDSLNRDGAIEDAKENHATIEGTWTPQQLRLDRLQRQREQWVTNHAGFEGAWFNRLL